MSMAAASDVKIRQSKDEDVKFLLKFVEEEQWDWSKYDHMSNTRLDPNYLLVAVNRFNEPVGFGGVVQNAPDTVYISAFIIRKDLRSQGIGRLLWKAMLERAGDRNIVLDATNTVIDLYKRKGLHFQTFKVFFHSVSITNDMNKHFLAKYDTATLSEDMWPPLMKYDQQVYPSFDRTAILRAWFSGEDVRVAVAMDVGKIIGYGSIHKKSDNSFGLRNVFGDNEDVVEALLHNLLSGLPEGTDVYFIILEDKRVPRYLQHSDRFEAPSQRMYSKVEIETITEKMWLATSHFV